jgi:hypothetical protein
MPINITRPNFSDGDIVTAALFNQSCIKNISGIFPADGAIPFSGPITIVAGTPTNPAVRFAGTTPRGFFFEPSESDIGTLVFTNLDLRTDGKMTADDVRTARLTVSGLAKSDTLQVSGATTLFGSLSVMDSISVFGAAALAALTTTGTIAAGGGITAPTLTTTGAVTSGSLTSSGIVRSATLQVTGVATLAGGVAGGLNVTGAIAASGNITGAAATFSGLLTAGDVSASTVAKILSGANLTAVKQAMFSFLYPVGTIYISADARNPNAYFGFGTWAAYGEGKVLVGVSSVDGDFNTGGKTGGSKTATLAPANIPAHKHNVAQMSGGSTTEDGQHSHDFIRDRDAKRFASIKADTEGGSEARFSGRHEFGFISIAPSGIHSHHVTIPAHETQNTGSGTAFSILPPYIAVYIWRRTA